MQWDGRWSSDAGVLTADASRGDALVVKEELERLSVSTQLLRVVQLNSVPAPENHGLSMQPRTVHVRSPTSPSPAERSRRTPQPLIRLSSPSLIPGAHLRPWASTRSAFQHGKACQLRRPT